MKIGNIVRAKETGALFVISDKQGRGMIDLNYVRAYQHNYNVIDSYDKILRIINLSIDSINPVNKLNFIAELLVMYNCGINHQVYEV